MLRLRGNLVSLRPLKKSDAEHFQPLLADRRVATRLPRVPYPYTMDDAFDWIRTTRRMTRNRTGFAFGIEGRREKAIIGMIALMDVKWDDRVAELGCWIGRPYWHRGYGSEAVDLMLRFGFRELKLYRIFAGVIETNTASLGLVRKVGFVHEGTSQKARLVGGRRCDMLWFGMLRSDYRRAR